MATAKLRVINSALSGMEFILPDHPVIVGRGGDSDVVIADQSVSRQHVRAEVKNGHCILTDLGSHNGIVMGENTLREAVLAPGDRFELGDIALTFIVEPEAEKAAAPPASAPAEYALAEARAPSPAERPVYVDDIFGMAAGASPAAGPGEQEKAAVAGAQNALKYAGVVVIILIAGAIAWLMAGSRTVEQEIKPVIVHAGETTVIDLGIETRQQGDRMTTYIDEGEMYDNPPVRPPDDEIASFELDPTGFMATITGYNIGTTDVWLAGSGRRRAIVRILVRGEVRRPTKEERRPADELIAQARLLVESGKAALNTSGHMYDAMKDFRKAWELLEPVKSPLANALREDADRRYRAASGALDREYDRVKRQAIACIHDRDTRAAALAWEKLLNLIPDREDVRNQKLAIIFNRTLRQL